jgi:GDP-L-fucose synthase
LSYLIKDIVQYWGNLIFDSSKPDGMPKKLLDVSKSQQLWWKYKTDFISWLKQTYEYYSEWFYLKPNKS